MPRTQYRCGVCDAVFETELELRGHMSGRMETNGGDHPHWNELEVRHHDLSAWKETVPGVTDYE
jgi:hypothetical protein